METSPADRQEINVALAALAKAGNAFALNQLWETNQGFIHQQIRKWYENHRTSADNAGMDIEDYLAESFFAVKVAAEHYDPAAGASFTTYLLYWLAQRCSRATVGGNGKHVIGSDGKDHYMASDPLHTCDRLDETPPGIDDDGTTRLDFVSDPNAQQPFDAVDDAGYRAALRRAATRPWGSWMIAKSKLFAAAGFSLYRPRWPPLARRWAYLQNAFVSRNVRPCARCPVIRAFGAGMMSSLKKVPGTVLDGNRGIGAEASRNVPLNTWKKSQA